MTEANKADVGEAERRIAPRMRTLKRAKVLFNNRFSTIDCIVRNISSTGALLTIDTAVQLPKTFEIMVGNDGGIRPAKLVYRREMFAGVRFLDVPAEEDTILAEIDAPSLQAEFEERGAIQRIVPRALPVALASLLPWVRAVR